MTFGEAIEALQNGDMVKRAFWDRSHSIKAHEDSILITEDYRIYEFTYKDVLAEDWMIVD